MKSIERRPKRSKATNENSAKLFGRVLPVSNLYEWWNVYDQDAFAKKSLVGIPDDEKSYLFREGYENGTGFGLYLIKRFCEAYGWTVQETGKQDKGVQFTITMPKTKDGKKLYEIS